MHRTPLRAPLVAASAVLLALVAGCSSDTEVTPEPDAPSTTPTASPTPEPEPIVTKATVRKVTGRMTPAARAQVRDKVAATVDAWFDAAYLAGTYPRTDFDDAFDVFTRGARARAEADRRLMSNAAVGTTTFETRALARRVRIDVLAKDGRASAVTAKFRLTMARIGETGNEVDERVSGHLYLTYSAGDGWRVFGYDVTRGQLQ